MARQQVGSLPVRSNDAIRLADLNGKWPIDIRKLAKFHEVLARTGSAKIVMSGDSTTEQLYGLNLIGANGVQQFMYNQFPTLRNVIFQNRGFTGTRLYDFAAPGLGSGGGNLAGNQCNLDDCIAAAPDLIRFKWGINDARGNTAPNGPGNPLVGNFPDWRGAYGSTGQVQMALVFQYWMKYCIDRVRATLPNCAIIWEIPNPINVDSIYMLNSVTPQQAMDVTRLAYRGDPALGVASIEDYKSGVLLFDPYGSLCATTAYQNPNDLISGVSDGLHCSTYLYQAQLFVIGLLTSGPSPYALGDYSDGVWAAAREKAIAAGWQAGKENIGVLRNSGMWDQPYTINIGANPGSYIDYGFGPEGDSNDKAWGGNSGEPLGNDAPPGIAYGDAIYWNETTFKTITNLLDANIGAIRGYSGQDISSASLPSPIAVNSTGFIYRQALAGSVPALRNRILRETGTAAQKNAAFKYEYLYSVVSTAMGSITLQGIGDKVDAARGTASDHVMSTDDVLCLAGIDINSGGISGVYGIPMTGATFAYSGRQITINKSGIDFRQCVGLQGVILSNSATGFGAAVLNFGAFPGTDKATTVITGCGAIKATTQIKVWMTASPTALHTEDELLSFQDYVKLSVPPSSIIPGTGFSVVGMCQSSKMWGTIPFNWEITT